MEFVRQIVDSNVLTSILDLPPSFQDVQVEVIVLPVDNKKNSLKAASSVPGYDVSIKPVKHTAYGRLKVYANPSLIPEEEGAWEKAATEKYALH
jgi:hypothetical protein